MPPPTLDAFAGRLQCMSHCGYMLDPVLGPVIGAALILSPLCALVYGLTLAGRPPSLLRTVVKTLPVGGMALYALLWGSPLFLVLALAACAVGDAFLSGNPQRWLPWGLFAFLIGHALYIALFVQFTDPSHVDGPVQYVAWSLIAILAVTLLAFVWKHVGDLRPAVVLYAVVISVMVGTAFRLPLSWDWPAVVGAVAFMLSDAILAISLFRGEVLFGSTRATNWAVWFLYFIAQYMISSEFIGFTT